MLKIGAIVWGVKDLHRSVAFWSEALDYTLRRPPDADFAILVPKAGEGVQLSLNAAVTSDNPNATTWTSSPRTKGERSRGFSA